MSRNDALERLAPLSGAPSRGFEDLLRLRAKRQLARKIGAIAVVTTLIVALAIGLGIEDRSHRPANPPDESHPGTFAGMVITYTSDPYSSGDLVAQDPTTGESRTVFHPQSPADQVVYSAAISGDGRWVAFNVATQCGDAGPGLWVANGVDAPRQLMDPCEKRLGSVDFGGWAWSPSGSQLAVAEGDHLVLIDPATGDRLDLGRAGGAATLVSATSLSWSPDGTQIAYATVPTGSPNGDSPSGSVYTVSVDTGEQSLIAESIGEVPTGEEGAGISWSPDGARIAVVAGSDVTLYVMNPDGSKRRSLAENVFVAHTLGSPNIAWSPDGKRLAYATFSPAHDWMRFWSVRADGSIPVLVFDPTSSAPHDTEGGGPIWSPDGTQIAFRYDSRSHHRSYLIANADGSGNVQEIDEVQYRSWRGGWYFCECYG